MTENKTGRTIKEDKSIFEHTFSDPLFGYSMKIDKEELRKLIKEALREVVREEIERYNIFKDYRELMKNFWRRRR